MSCYSSGAEWLAVLADIAQIAGLGVAICAIAYAKKSLETWKSELRAGSEHQVALRALAAVDHTLSAIRRCRNPNPAMDAMVPPDREHQARSVLAEFHSAELDPVIENLSAIEREARYAFSESYIAESMRALVAKCDRLRFTLTFYLDLVSTPPGERNEAARRRIAKQEEILFENSFGPDEFDTDLKATVDRLREYLSARLVR